MSDERLHDLIQEADADGDGKISYLDFHKCMSKKE